MFHAEIQQQPVNFNRPYSIPAAVPASHGPTKKREAEHCLFDSQVWNDFAFRDDDIIIGSYAKSGTTWLQQIVGQLIFQGAPDTNVAELSPWYDMRVPPLPVRQALVENQANRRFLKTHLPADALVFAPSARYIYVARDGRDVLLSYYNHHVNFTADAIRTLNEPCPAYLRQLHPLNESIPEFFDRWLENDGEPLWPYWENISTWWAIRHTPNVLLTHFADLKADLEKEMRRIAGFLGIPINGAWFADAVRHSGFAFMKANANRIAPLGGAIWEGGGGTFINRGVNGRWKDILSSEQSARYEEAAASNLGPECANWLANGGRI